MKSSDYINQQRREYSLYVLSSRAIPHAADGLKAAARRVLWVAKDGKKRKSATLAGECMPYHPHASPESTVNTLGADYGNNIPLIKGEGGFGTLLIPTSFAASRYTSATISKFAQDVVLRDIEIIPMQENYDSTLEEPKHFLPLIPIVLLNPQGIAVGFASDILPRSLTDIINNQIAYLTGNIFKEPKPTFAPTNQKAIKKVDDKWIFHGEIKKESAVNVRVTNLPYGMLHEKFENFLLKLIDEDTIIEFQDESRKVIDILVTFKKGSLSGKTDIEILDTLGLIKAVSENLNVIDFDGERVWNPSYAELIEKFCDWRLKWYKTRYQRLANLLNDEMQRYKDILRAISRGIGAVAHKIQSRDELKEYLTRSGIVNIDYIADLAIYRFTEEERIKVENKLVECETKMKEYQKLLKSEDERRNVYIQELREVLSKYNKGAYTTG